MKPTTLCLLTLALVLSKGPTDSYAGPLGLEMTKNSLHFHLPRSYFEQFHDRGNFYDFQEVSKGLLHRLEHILFSSRALKSVASDENDEDDDGQEEEEDSEDSEEDELKPENQKGKFYLGTRNYGEKLVEAIQYPAIKRATEKKRLRKSTNFSSVRRSSENETLSNTEDVPKQENTTRLREMVYKLIKSQGVTSVADMPCRNTLSWFPGLLHRLDYEIPGFKYYCIDSEKNSQDDIRSLFSDSGNPEFMHVRPTESDQLPRVDMIFSWNGPQQWGIGVTWAFFSGIRQVRPDLVVVTNNPGVINSNAGPGVINLRKQPFHVSLFGRVTFMVLLFSMRCVLFFLSVSILSRSLTLFVRTSRFFTQYSIFTQFNQAMRVIGNMESEGSEVKKQLLVYNMDEIRKGF